MLRIAKRLRATRFRGAGFLPPALLLHDVQGLERERAQARALGSLGLHLAATALGRGELDLRGRVALGLRSGGGFGPRAPFGFLGKAAFGGGAREQRIGGGPFDPRLLLPDAGPPQPPAGGPPSPALRARGPALPRR